MYARAQCFCGGCDNGGDGNAGAKICSLLKVHFTKNDCSGTTVEIKMYANS